MMKNKIPAGSVLNVCITPDKLYSLAQMRDNHYLQFFDVSNDVGKWNDVDLNSVASLFCNFVAESKLKSLLVDVLSPEKVKPRLLPPPTVGLAYDILGAGFPNVALVEMGPEYDCTKFKIIKPRLNFNDDMSLILQHEFLGTFGDAEKLRSRLLRYFEKGINWDETKNYLFPGIAPPQ